MDLWIESVYVCMYVCIYVIACARISEESTSIPHSSPYLLQDYEGIAKAFKEIKDDGKATTFGISNFHEWEYEPLKEG